LDPAASLSVLGVPGPCYFTPTFVFVRGPVKTSTTRPDIPKAIITLYAFSLIGDAFYDLSRLVGMHQCDSHLHGALDLTGAFFDHDKGFYDKAFASHRKKLIRVRKFVFKAAIAQCGAHIVHE